MVKVFDLEIDRIWIEQSVADRRQETLNLDFKGGRILEQGRLTNDGRRVLGVALSAFANSAGGVLVIGVDARKNSEGIDCAQTLMPVANVERALSELSQAVGELLQPRHDGIQTHSIMNEAGTGEGYLVVAVPRSDRRPHMSQPHHQYFRRSGTSSYVMEHFDIEDMFKAVVAPELALKTQVTSRGTGSNEYGTYFAASILLQLHNVGRVTAKHVNIEVEASTGASLPGFVTEDGLPAPPLTVGRKSMFWLPPNAVIHPGQARTIVAVAVTLQRSWDGDIAVTGGWDLDEGIRFSWAAAAEHAGITPLREFSFPLRPLIDQIPP